MKKYKSIDLFAGIGGIRIGFDKAFGKSIETVFVSEWDEKAQETYQTNFADNFNIAGDITLVNEREIPEFDICLAGFPCLTEDTLVLTNCGYKKITEVKEGDKVLSHDKKYHTVEAIFYQGEKQVYSVKSSGTLTISATENHKFYVKEKTMEKNKRMFSEPKWVPVSELIKKPNAVYFFASPINQNSIVPTWEGTKIYKNQTKYIIQNTLDMQDKALWYIIGRYLGDGWLRKQHKSGKVRNDITGLIICCNKNETELLAKKIGNSFKFTISHEKTVDRFIFCNTELGNFASLFGEYSYGKTLPGFVYDMPTDLLKELIMGYFDSDGHYLTSDKNWLNITSINYRLLYSVAHCIEKVYRTPCKIRRANKECYRKIEGRLVHNSESYILTFSKKMPSKSVCFYEDEYLWYPVKKVTKSNVSSVYDIQVKDSHSFVANHCLTHNCQAFSIAGQKKGFEDNYKGICRGTLFLDVARICEYHKPKVIFCENVKGLVSHDKGNTLKVIYNTFESLGYKVFYKVLNSKDFGVPQNRERIYIVAFRNDIDCSGFEFPDGTDNTKTIRDIIEENPVPAKYYISDVYYESLKRHKAKQEAKGNGFGYDIRPLDGVANTIVCGGMGKERNLIIDKRQTDLTPTTHIKGEINKEGIRKMTPREWARLQGFPDTYILPLKDTHHYKQFGNSVTVNVIEAIANNIKKVLERNEAE